MPAMRCFTSMNVAPLIALGDAPLAFGDDFGLVPEFSGIATEREDAVWSDLPIPVSVTIPLDGPMSCEAVLPAHYEPRYSYPLIVWLNPADDVEFRERITAISDRNFVSVALYWRGFDDPPTSSVIRTAECMQFVENALAFVESVWNIHDGRRFLIADGAEACAWEVRLAEHRPDLWEAAVCIRPGDVTANTTAMRRKAPVSAQRLLTVTDDQHFADAHDRSQLSRHINNWLMSCVNKS